MSTEAAIKFLEDMGLYWRSKASTVKRIKKFRLPIKTLKIALAIIRMLLKNA